MGDEIAKASRKLTDERTALLRSAVECRVAARPTAPGIEVREMVKALNDEIDFQGRCFRSKAEYPMCPGLLERARDLIQRLAGIEGE